MFCPNCGSQTTEGASFCERCGARLTESAPAAPVQRPAPMAAPKKKTSRLPFILGIGVIVAAVAAAVVILVLMMSGGESEIDYKATVRAYKPFDKSQGLPYTCGEVFDQYVPDARWTVREEDGMGYVDISGKAKGTDEKLLVTMEVVPDAKDPGIVSVKPVQVSMGREELSGWDETDEFFLSLFVAYDEKREDLSEFDAVRDRVKAALRGDDEPGGEPDDPQPVESAPQPVESAPQPARGLSAGAERAYAEKVLELSAEYGDMKFALIDLTDNNDLDLAVVNTGYSVSVYTWSGGRLIPIMEQWAYGAAGNQGYEYLPGRNVIRNLNSDYAGAIIYENYLYLNSAYEPQWPSAEEQLSLYYFDDANGSGWPDDGEPFTEEPIYYFGGVEVSREEYASHQVQGEFLWIDGDRSAEEMLTLLHYDDGGTSAPAPGGSDAYQALRYKMAGDEYAEFLMIADGTFTMKVNLYECIGTITGTYEDAGDRMKCHVVSRDFSGFSGDDVEEFEMLYGDAALLYRGADIGTTEDGTIFRHTL